MEETYVLMPNTVEFIIAVRPIDETKPTVPRPTIEEASSTGSIMLEILLVRPSMEERNAAVEIYPSVPKPIAVLWMGTVASCAKVCPLMLETTICGVQTVPLAVKMPVLIWRVE